MWERYRFLLFRTFTYMITLQTQYETLLCQYCNQLAAIDLLKQYRPYFELLPSVRRPTESLICLPLPVVKIANSQPGNSHMQIQCDVVIIMCDPEWKIKTGREVFVFIHRPGEDFSGLLSRWRQVEVMMGEDYFWLLPWKYRQIMSDKGEYHYPLFVTLGYTPDRIKNGLSGASLPFVSVSFPELDSLTLEPQEGAIAEIDPS
jgi:hypothetical protein